MGISTLEGTQLSSWGNYPVVTANVVRPERYAELQQLRGRRIARGLGRSYGDAALLSKGQVVLMERLDRFLAIDDATGIVRAEAGVSLESLLHHLLPRGWFPPVTPGTKFVTLGGCVAADVHGKNHHCDGTFGAHVQELELVLADGSVRRCSPSEDKELFWATIGGMGLTGIISEVTLQMTKVESAYMMTHHHSAKDLEAVLRLLAEGGADDKYSVAWIDCLASGRELGRSVVILGHHANADQLSTKQRHAPLKVIPGRQASIPLMLPFSLVNSWSVKAFNAFYYWLQSAKTEEHVVGYDSFFYPLDVIHHWNRIYGKKGFVQYQCVLPTQTAAEGLKALLERLTTSRRASFLAVLKRFGPEGSGLLSFPMPGFTLALDIPVDAGLFSLLDDLDAEVLRHGGRVYLAKDARLSASAFRTMYPRYEAFAAVKAAVDPTNSFCSDLSLRLNIGEQR